MFAFSSTADQTSELTFCPLPSQEEQKPKKAVKKTAKRKAKAQEEDDEDEEEEEKPKKKVSTLSLICAAFDDADRLDTLNQ